MTDRLSIALAQLNPTVGDLTGNLARARAARAEAAAAGADLIVFPELFITGYPIEDLALKPALQRTAREAVEDLAKDTADDGPAILIGLPWAEDDRLFNSAVLLCEGQAAAVRHKHMLPNYGVFDEMRVFEAGDLAGPIAIRPSRGGLVKLGVMICEDMWSEEVAEELAEAGTDILVSLNGSPFDETKRDGRMAHAIARMRETDLPLVYVNQVGGQDELVFDGASFVLNRDSRIPVQLPAFAEALAVTEWHYDPHKGWACAEGMQAGVSNGPAAVYGALMLGLRDYVEKNRFPGVLLGLSGGVDSAISAAIAVDALGPDRVRGVMLPSRYTSEESHRDAEESARLLGIRYDTVPIESAVGAFSQMLAELMSGTEPDETEENIQSRIRGIVLMALSNKFGHMLLTTGNKSEMSVGYATLYGDMAGGYSVLKDVYKTDVFKLCHWRNDHHPEGALGPEGRVIPENAITKPPSAELRPGQTDQDSLPPYEVLDDILRGLVEEELAAREVVARGHAPELVAKVERMLYLAEYKRRQAPPGVKISRRNFGRDRRYPITNWFRTVNQA